MSSPAKLVYGVIQSLDGYIEDEDGKFSWGEPDEEAHSFVNDLEREAETYLYGRRLYETMVAWETIGPEGHPRHIAEYGQIWRAAEKIVYSRTLRDVSSARTRIERDFEPDAVRELKAAAARDLRIGGANLAAQAFASGLVDEVHLFIAPVVVGGGKRALPDGVGLELDLLDERRLGSGMVFLRYRSRSS